MASSKVSPQKQRPPRRKRAVSKKKAQRRKINRYIRISGRVALERECSPGNISC